MKKTVIIQIYNNLQVLWNSKVKFVHCLICWDDPILGLTLVLSQLQILLSECRDKKGREGGRED